MSGEPVSVLIAEDHPIYRDGLAGMVGSDPRLEVVAVCPDGPGALARIRELSPHVAVLDHELPGLNAQEILTAFSHDALVTRILILSAFTDGERVLAAIEAGAAGYLSKGSGRKGICDAIVAIAGGEVVIEPALQTSLALALRERREAAILTSRELEVLNLLAAGFSAPQIADHVMIATSTVKTHLAHVYEKLGVGDRAAAVAEGMRRGLIL